MEIIMRVQSVMSHTFSAAPQASIPRSQFNRSHGCKTTFDAGYLVPIFVDEALPGDTFNLNLTGFSRLATPKVPVMDNLYMDTFFFAVPIRLIWDNWQKFNGEQVDPDDSTDYVVPTMTSTAGTGYLNGSLHDYLGLPTEVPGLDHMSLYHRAYNLIWNEWFRDENLQDSLVVDRDDGPDVPTDYVLQRRGKRYDYFTSCLPWPQKGPSVSLGLSGNAPVYGAELNWGVPYNAALFQGVTSADVRHIGGVAAANTTGNMSFSNTTGLHGFMNLATKADYVTAAGTDPGVYTAPFADLSGVAAATINELRQAFQIQKLYERDARGGTRYTEIIRSHFGVTSPDARLQRPEYLGGGSSPVNINPVAQTAPQQASGVTTPQGNLAAFGTATLQGHGFVKSFTEHCIIIGLVSTRADLNYQQGLTRPWSRATRWDFYWPALSHIGEQAVLNKEIYAQGTGNPTADAGVFGYQERYAEYRYKPSIVTGQFRSNFAQTLDVWHLAQDFGSLPTLNETFIVENPPVDRVIATTDYPHFLFDSFISLKCARPMPVYSVPGLVDHF